MKRKLVKQGNGALTLTLPYEWVLKNNLQKGNYLDLIESGKDLILSSDFEKVNKSYEITISDEKPFFKRYLRTCYVLGYDSIIVSSADILPIDIIKEALSSLIGYEIVEQTTRKCVISIVASPYEQNFDVILKRIFYMISSMLDDVIQSISQKKFDELSKIAATEKSINTFVDFCLRILNKRGYKEFSKTPYFYQILIELEQVGDAIRDFLLNFNCNDTKILIFLEELKAYFENLQQMFFKYDMKKIKQIKQQRIQLYKNIREAASKYPTEMLDLYLMLSTLHQFEIAIDPINN
jgi:phosphate uptake regulator